ncbi:MAG: metallophosphoesterase [Myxococcales bacterium]|nr:metallophosphoesterase [Myxococcales bacterium]MCB9704186.1 metallophosphoesterase [Myxococcales bacterium]
MIQLSPDPAIAEQQIDAIIYYLTTCGYIDTEFDLREKAFIRSYLRQIVTSRIDALGPMDAEVRFEQIEGLHNHYIERFQEIEQEVRALLHEAVADGEEAESFVRSRLMLGCYERLSDLRGENRDALIEMVDEFIAADGEIHPAELAFRNELAEHLGAEIMIDESALEGLGIAIDEPATLVPQTHDHPFFQKLEHHYSADPATIRAQVAADLKLLERAEAIFAKQRAAGRGRLRGHQHVTDFAGGDEFLDGHVYVVPSRPSRDYELIVLGDLHGCYSNLKAAILQSGFMEKVRAFRADPENNPDVRLVLLGDYIDRGRFSYNGVFRAVLNLFLTVPEHVFVLRGNHEYYIEFQGKIHAGVRPAEAIHTLSPLVPDDVFARYLDFFESMPNMLFFDQILFVHAGIPRDSLLVDRWADLSSLNDKEIRFQMLWSDPSPAEFIPTDLQNASARFAFGRKQFRKFMSAIDCNTLVRGHEKINAGFRSLYPDEDIRLFTLFSAGGVANDDIPQDSNYRDVRPMALTITSRDGETRAIPWAIDYRRFQGPEYNAFFRSAPELDI